MKVSAELAAVEALPLSFGACVFPISPAQCDIYYSNTLLYIGYRASHAVYDELPKKQ